MAKIPELIVDMSQTHEAKGENSGQTAEEHKKTLTLVEKMKESARQ